jgi:DNA polymerase
MLKMTSPKKVTKKLCKERGWPLERVGTDYWVDDPASLTRLFDYCKQDVRAENDIDSRTVPLLDSERETWLLDRVINERGVPIDKAYCEGAVAILEQSRDIMAGELPRITENVVHTTGQTAKLLEWLNLRGVNIGDMQAGTVSAALDGDLPDDTGDPENLGPCRAVLEMRQNGAPAAVKKYQAALDREVEGRVYEEIRYYQAGTGRWAGAGLQLHNLFRGSVPDAFVEAITTGNLATVSDLCRDYVSDDPKIKVPRTVIKALQSGVRQIVCAPPGSKLVTADLSAIEARGALWLARSPGLDMFRAFDRGEGPEPYKVGASQIFNTPVLEISDDQRQVGKVYILMLQYGAGAMKFQSFCRSMGGVDLPFEECERIVKRVYRRQNQHITRLWSELERGMKAILAGRAKYRLSNGVEFAAHGTNCVTMGLPSGRKLFYWEAKNTKTGLQYRTHKGYIEKIWGGFLLENLTQAVCRDILVSGLHACEQRGLNPVLHVHDSISCQVANDQTKDAQAELTDIMSTPPEWAKNFPQVGPAVIAQRFTK